MEPHGQQQECLQVTMRAERRAYSLFSPGAHRASEPECPWARSRTHIDWDMGVNFKAPAVAHVPAFPAEPGGPQAPGPVHTAPDWLRVCWAGPGSSVFSSAGTRAYLMLARPLPVQSAGGGRGGRPVILTEDTSLPRSSVLTGACPLWAPL